MNDPTPIAAAAVAPTSLEQAIANWEAQVQRDPEGTFRPGVCRHCNVSLGDKPEDKAISLGAFGWLPNVCCAPCAEAGKQRLVLEEAKERSGRLSSVIPAEFAWWNPSLGNNDALAAAIGKFSMSSRRGMVVHGSSGSCKTRVMWELVKRIVEAPDPYTWLFLDSYDCATAGFPAEAARVDFLFLDDLGNEPTSTKFETALLRLIRKRCDWHKPIFISTQLTGIAFKQRFFEGAAADAIMRRLTERTDKVATNAAQERKVA